MISHMRRNRRALQVGLLVIIAAFIASLFVFGSSGFESGPAGDAVATVNGETIPLDRFQRRYQAYLDAYSRVYRERFSPALAEQLGLPQQVLDDLVQEALVVQRAQREGLEVGDEELSAQLHAVEAFHEGGRFSLARYQEFLRRRGMTAAAFERDARRELTRMKMESAVRSGVKVSDAEVEQAWIQRHEAVRAAWALVETGPLVRAATASDEEVEAYLKDNEAEFRQPERRKVQYVTVAAKDFRPVVTDADVERHYNEHASEFETPPEVQAAHVLVTVADTGGSEAEDRAREKVADVIRRAKGGESFARLAAEVSEDPGTKGKGGELGWVRRGEMVPQFEEAVFKLAKKEITAEPVRTPFGYHAIRVTDIREGGRRPLKDVAGAIRTRLAAEAADAQARAKAEEDRAALHGGADFMAEGKRLGLAPQEAVIPRTDTTVQVGGPDPFEEAAFTLTLGGVSAPVKTPGGWMIVKAVESIPAGVPPLSEIRDKVAAAVTQRKAEAEALTRAQQIAEQARQDGGKGDFAGVARRAGATTGETSRFSRAKPADRPPGDVQLAALQTPAGQVTEPVRTPQGVWVARVLERVPPDVKDLAAERDRVRTDLLSQKQRQAWESWVAEARAGAKIDVQSRAPGRG